MKLQIAEKRAKPHRTAAPLGVFAGFLLALVFAWAGAGCQSAGPSPSAAMEPAGSYPGTANYATNTLQEGDVLNITFQYSTNFNTIQKVTLDGMLNFEGVGQIKAAGRTQLELQEEVARLYKPQTKDDVVTVKLVSGATSIYVAGAVFRPGKVALERPLTVLEAIVEAGGFDPNRANLARVSVLRIVNGRQLTYHVNLKRIIQGQDESPFYLRPFDVVHVPTKTFNF